MIIKKDSIAPEIKLINPIDWSIKIYEDNFFNLKATIKDISSIKTINVKIDWVIIKAWLIDRNIVLPINSDSNIPIWKHIITIEAIDWSFNKAEQKIYLEVIER